MTRATAWWAVRTPRERRLLGALAVLAALMIGWFGVVRPLDALLRDARRAHADALDAEIAARGRVARLGVLRGQARTGLPAPLATYVQGSAADAGFTGAAIVAEAAGRVRVSIPTARPQAAFAWLDGLRARGIVVHAVAMRPAQGATVSIEAVLAGGRPG